MHLPPCSGGVATAFVVSHFVLLLNNHSLTTLHVGQ